MKMGENGHDVTDRLISREDRELLLSQSLETLAEWHSMLNGFKVPVPLQRDGRTTFSYPDYRAGILLNWIEARCGKKYILEVWNRERWHIPLVDSEGHSFYVTSRYRDKEQSFAEIADDFSIPSYQDAVLGPGMEQYAKENVVLERMVEGPSPPQYFVEELRSCTGNQGVDGGGPSIPQCPTEGRDNPRQ